MTNLDAPQLVPHVAVERDRVLPIVVAASLLVHVAVLAPLAWRGHASPAPEVEIPVELIQASPPEKAKPPAPKPPSTPPKQAAPQKPEPKPEAKQQSAKREPKRQEPKTQDPPKQPSQPSADDRMRALLGQVPDVTGARTPDVPMPGAVVLPGEAPDGDVSVGYRNLVLSKVVKGMTQGRHRGMPGKTIVVFALSDKGEVENVGIDPPSGNPMLDDEAIEMVKRGAPYPPPPPGAKRNFAIGLSFKADAQ